MDVMQTITEIKQRAANEQMLRDEKKLLADFQAAEKVTTKGVTNAINSLSDVLQAAEWAEALRHYEPEVIIVNATTAAAIRRQMGEQPGVKIIITAAADTGTVYQVVDKELKKQLLAAIGERW